MAQSGRSLGSTAVEISDEDIEAAYRRREEQLASQPLAVSVRYTARAREAAAQFAHDSKSEIGEIRQASQGVFEILLRDQAPGISEESQIFKTVRVVSTIDYALG